MFNKPEDWFENFQQLVSFSWIKSSQSCDVDDVSFDVIA